MGYGCGLNPEDRILVAVRDQSIVAAVRLCSEGGLLVLRGMFVAGSLRRTGIGTVLLDRASEEIGSSDCWWIPYTYLESFYSRIGFGVCCGEVPPFLATREKEYLAAGREVMIMHRASTFSRS